MGRHLAKIANLLRDSYSIADLITMNVFRPRNERGPDDTTHRQRTDPDRTGGRVRLPGAQACRALQEEGARVVLVNSNPATIMTDPETADRVYIEPITPEAISEVIRIEEPDGVIAGLGGQTGLNVTAELAEEGIFWRSTTSR